MDAFHHGSSNTAQNLEEQNFDFSYQDIYRLTGDQQQELALEIEETSNLEYEENLEGEYLDSVIDSLCSLFQLLEATEGGHLGTQFGDLKMEEAYGIAEVTESYLEGDYSET